MKPTPTIKITAQLMALDPNREDYKKQRMKLMVSYLQNYMRTYDQQPYYENYTDTTLINDVLYGLGLALNPAQHQFADGFDDWKNTLAQFIETGELNNGGSNLDYN